MLFCGGLFVAGVSAGGEQEVGVEGEDGEEGEDEEGGVLEDVVVFEEGEEDDRFHQEVGEETGEGVALCVLLGFGLALQLQEGVLWLGLNFHYRCEMG